MKRERLPSAKQEQGLEDHTTAQELTKALQEAPFFVYYAFGYQSDTPKPHNTPDQNLIVIPDAATPPLTFPDPLIPSQGLIARASNLFTALGLQPADMTAAYPGSPEIQLDTTLPPARWEELGDLALPHQSYGGSFYPQGGQVLADLLEKQILFVIKDRDHTLRSHIVVPQKEVQSFLEKAQRRLDEFLRDAPSNEVKFIKGYQKLMDLVRTHYEMSSSGSSDATRTLSRKISCIKRSIQEHVPSASRRAELTKLVATTKPREMDLEYYYMAIHNPEAFFQARTETDLEANTTLLSDLEAYTRTFDSKPNFKIPWKIRKSFKRWMVSSFKGKKVKNIPKQAIPEIWMDPTRLLLVHYANTNKGTAARRIRYDLNANAAGVPYKNRFFEKFELWCNPGYDISIYRNSSQKIPDEAIHGYEDYKRKRSGQSDEIMHVLLDRFNAVSSMLRIPGGTLNVEWDKNELIIRRLSLNGRDVASNDARVDKDMLLLPIGPTHTLRIPLHIDAKTVYEKLVHPEIINNPFNADPKYDTWQEVDFKEALGITILET